MPNDAPPPHVQKAFMEKAQRAQEEKQKARSQQMSAASPEAQRIVELQTEELIGMNAMINQIREEISECYSKLSGLFNMLSMTREEFRRVALDIQNQHEELLKADIAGQSSGKPEDGSASADPGASDSEGADASEPGKTAPVGAEA
jgi:flagellar hook assembly protein FlgD